MLRNIKHLKFLNKVITVPNGYDTLREHGNILKDGNKFIFISTATRQKDGKKEYSTHYWIATNRENWQYKGKLNLPFQSEDLHLSKEHNKYIAMYENKSSEKFGRFIISYAVADSIGGAFTHYPTYGYEPIRTGIDGCVAVYSPLRKSASRAFIDGRWDNSPLKKEIVGTVKWTSNGWGKFRILMEPNDYGYNTMGVGGSVHTLGDEHVLELTGGMNYTPPPNKYIKWVNGLVLLDSNFNVKKMLNKVLKDKDGNAVWATFANDGDWFALSRKRGTNDIYLAKIIEKGSGSPDPEPIGEDMNLKATISNGKILLEWDHPAGVNNIHFEDDIRGYFATKDVLAHGKFEFDDVGSTKFRARPNNISVWGEWVELEGQSSPLPDPEPNDNVAIANQIIELARKIT